MNSLILNVAIGLVFSFAVLAAVTSIITEGIARFLGLRGEYLLRGLRTMLDGDSDFALFHGWMWPFLAPKDERDAKKAAKQAEREKNREAKNSGKADDSQERDVPSTDKDQTDQQPSNLADAQGGATRAPIAPDTPSRASSTVMPAEASEWAWVAKVMAHPLIRSSMREGKLVARAGDRKMSSRERRKLPPYVSSRSFAQAVLDLAVPDKAGKTTFDDLEKAITRIDSPVLQKSLLSLLKSAQGDVDEFRRALERWYDDHMARVSGWYKRHVRWISLAIGLALVIAFNVNAIAIGRALYSDEALRGAVVTEAAQASDCSGDASACLKKIEDQIAEAKTLGLPLGWTPISRCPTPEACSAWDAYGLADPDHNGAADVFFFLTVLLGYGLMIASIVPGARFWFDLLGKLGSLRSTGPKPTPST